MYGLIKIITYMQVPEKVLISCAHLLVSLLTGVRPAHLYNFPALQRLYADGLKVHNCPQEVNIKCDGC